jgi:AraC-like DNA-binding protein
VFFSSYLPKQPLDRFIENFWCYEGYASPYPMERIFPDGTFKLVFNLQDDELRIYDSRQNSRTFSGAIVARPSGTPFVTDSTEESAVLGVNFRLGGALPILGFASVEPGGSHIDLRDVCGRGTTELQLRLSECSQPEKRFHILEQWLLGQLNPPTRHRCEVLAALETLGRPQHGSRTREVARDVGLSERRFIELFKTEVVVTPKLFSRVRRFQHALSRVCRNAPRVDWAIVAVDCGYYDQSHLIRDFDSFAGVTPLEYVDRLQYLLRHGVSAKPNHLPLVEHGKFSPIHPSRV